MEHAETAASARLARRARLRAEHRRQFYDANSYALLTIGMGCAVLLSIRALRGQPFTWDWVFMVALPLTMATYHRAHERKPLVGWLALAIATACVAVWVSLTWSPYWGLAYVALLTLISVVAGVVRRRRHIASKGAPE